MPRLLDTTPAFESYARTAFLDPPAVREELWGERYESVHPEVFEAFYADQPDRSGRHALVRELSRVRQLAKDAAPITAGIIEQLEPAVVKALGVEVSGAGPLHVLMIGSHATNALVGRVGGEVTLFHCLEWFYSEDGARVVVAHEDTHAWHELSLACELPKQDLAWVAFSEGLAIAVSREVVPDRPEDDYFWYGYSGFEGWLDWCREHRAELIERFAATMDDPDAAEIFFGSGLVDGRWRVGHYVADELMGALGRPLPELAAMTVAEAQATIREAVAKLE